MCETRSLECKHWEDELKSCMGSCQEQYISAAWDRSLWLRCNCSMTFDATDVARFQNDAPVGHAPFEQDKRIVSIY